MSPCDRCGRRRSNKAQRHPHCRRCVGDNQREWQREGQPTEFKKWAATEGFREHMRRVGRLRRGLWRAQLLAQASGAILLDGETEELLRRRLGLPERTDAVPVELEALLGTAPPVALAPSRLKRFPVVRSRR